LTVLDSVEGFRSTAETNQSILLACLEVQNLIREIGLIENYAELEDETFDEIERVSRLCELALASNPPDQGLPMLGPPPAAPTAAPDSPPSVPANTPSTPGAPPLASDAVASPLRAAEAAAIDSPDSSSSLSVGATLVADAREAIMSAALVSMHDRQNRLTSLVQHLTVDPEASAETTSAR
jgi:hypothetical protein